MLLNNQSSFKYNTYAYWCQYVIASDLSIDGSKELALAFFVFQSVTCK